jgi:hypothetical protein
MQAVVKSDGPRVNSAKSHEITFKGYVVVTSAHNFNKMWTMEESAVPLELRKSWEKDFSALFDSPDGPPPGIVHCLRTTSLEAIKSAVDSRTLDLACVGRKGKPKGLSPPLSELEPMFFWHLRQPAFVDDIALRWPDYSAGYNAPALFGDGATTSSACVSSSLESMAASMTLLPEALTDDEEVDYSVTPERDARAISRPEPPCVDLPLSVRA